MEIRNFFKFNGISVDVPLTMPEAIKRARERVIERKKAIRLEALAKSGKWVFLGQYEPHPEGGIKYVDRQTDKLCLYPCCISKPAPLTNEV